jgi:hypothetical protein
MMDSCRTGPGEGAPSGVTGKRVYLEFLICFDRCNCSVAQMTCSLVCAPWCAGRWLFTRINTTGAVLALTLKWSSIQNCLTKRSNAKRAQPHRLTTQYFKAGRPVLGRRPFNYRKEFWWLTLGTFWLTFTKVQNLSRKETLTQRSNAAWIARSTERGKDGSSLHYMGMYWKWEPFWERCPKERFLLASEKGRFQNQGSQGGPATKARGLV